MITKEEQYKSLIEEIKKHAKMPPAFKKYVDDYIKTIENTKQPTLEQLRDEIMTKEEVIEYCYTRFSKLLKNKFIFPSLEIEDYSIRVSNGNFYIIYYDIDEGKEFQMKIKGEDGKKITTYFMRLEE